MLRRAALFNILVCLPLICVEATLMRTARATNPGSTVVGAIRWDGQTGSSDAVGAAEEIAMAPNAYHYRLPFYGTEPSASSVTMNGTTQAIMDQEIAYAKDAGINYWAFCWYSPGSPLAQARNLYLSSQHKNDVKWAVILFTDAVAEADVDWLVTQFQQPNYQKVRDGRPLVYAYNYPQNADPARIASLRLKTQFALDVQPYVVALEFSPEAAATFAGKIYADALSSYVSPSGDMPHDYSSIANSEQSNWSAYSYKNGRAVYQVVPWVTAGWDPRPRIYSNPPYPFAPPYPPNGFMTRPTPSELSSQLQSAINWTQNNAGNASANAVLMYAWNEFSEGGFIAPIKSGNGVDRDYVNAVKGVLTSPSVSSGDSNTSFLTSINRLSASCRTNYGDHVGMKITTTSTPVTVTQLGRYWWYTNHENHILKIVNASDGTDVASAVINMGAGSPDALGFKYASLATPVTLAANTSYYFVSSESNGGDCFFDFDTSISISGVATVDHAAYRHLGSNNEPRYENFGSSNNSYGPLNFRYATPDTSFATAASTTYQRNDYSGFVGAKVTTRYWPVVVSQLGRYYLPGNSQKHLLKIVRASDNSDLIAITLDMSQGSPDSRGFKYARLPYEITLPPNTSYYIVSFESVNGDTWYNSDTYVYNTAVANINNAVYQSGNSYVSILGQNNSYGPVNFKYATDAGSFIAGSNLSAVKRNDFDGSVGMKITTGGYYLFVNQLGRFYLPGNTRVHALKIVDASNKGELASVNIDMSQGTIDRYGFKYAALPTAVILLPYSSYYVLSSERSDGDQWYDADSFEAVNTDWGYSTVDSAVYQSGNSYFLARGSGNSYGPVNLRF